MLRLAALLCLVALPAAATDLRGAWKITTPARPNTAGNVLIDAQGRVTWDIPTTNGASGKFVGIAQLQNSRVLITLTDYSATTKLNCVVESSDLIVCHQPPPRPIAILTRVGPGPESLAPPPRTQAESGLLGQWRFAYTSNADYSGIVVLESGHRASLTAVWSGGSIPAGSVKETGRTVIAHPKIEMIFADPLFAGTGGYNPDHFFCTVRSTEVLDCYNVDRSGSTSAPFAMRRILPR